MALRPEQMKTVVKPYQKYFLHPVSAILFSICAGFVVDQFYLFNFSGAAYWMSAVVFIGYMLLSRRYDPSMSYIFFFAALFVAYKVAGLDVSQGSEKNFQDSVKNRLVYLGSQVELYRFKNKALPKKLSDLNVSGEQNKIDESLSLCLQNDCDNPLKGVDQSLLNESEYAIISSAVNDQPMRFLSSNFEIFKKTVGSNQFELDP